MLERPTLYFRRKENATVIYRVDAGEHGRLDMQQIAMLKQNGDVKPTGGHTPTEAELAEVDAWHKQRKSEQKQRDAARVDRLIGDINAAAQWVQANANDKQIAESAQPILMAMHDLRSTLVRRMAGKSGKS